MSLSFTDEDLAKTSLENVQYPLLRANAVQGLALAQATVDDLLAQDEANKPFTDFYRTLLVNYSLESNYLDQQGYTGLPSEGSLDDGARRDEKYYPVQPNPWVNLPPIIQPENSGLPRIAYNGTTEQGSITAIKVQIDGIINGISGSGSSQVETAYTPGDPLVRADDVTVFSIGDFIFVINGTDALFGEITAINQDPGICTGGSGTNEADCLLSGGTWSQPTTGDLVIDVLQAPSAVIPAGTNITSGFAGFSNAEREESVGLTPERQAQLDVVKNLLDNAVQTYETFLTGSVLPVNNTNLDDLKNKADIEANIVDLNQLVTDINDWQSFPSTNPTGTESRFGDVKLADLDGYLDERLTYITGTRLPQIATAIGSVSQGGDGQFSGSGILFDFADWENKRINTATGTLAKYYNALIALEVQQQLIDNLDSNNAEQNVYFEIEALTFNADGTNTIFVGDTTGYLVNDSVKVFAEGQPVINAVVQSTTATAITLDVTVGTDYTISNVARILKQN